MAAQEIGRTAAFGLTLLLGLAAAGPVVAQDAEPLPTRDHLQLGVGMFDVFDQEHEAVDFGAIYRPGVRYLTMDAEPGDIWRGVGPQIGARINTDGGALGHVGLYLDIRPFENIVIWPGTNVAVWEEGDSRDLGGTLEFMSELYVGYRLPWDDLVGVSLQHVSNAHLHDENPGSDSLMATYTVSFGPLFAE
ncbi:acyloxyacyl hydrolase [Rhodovibrio salinarum]|uniref:Acyloxyacyl hydrolase n=1 Tax=Rhodovibrio salinarum TaxID=1087 RepID=A0A934V2S4_9PROT|nr:acyloxyacyl hydrolase [Rhodovibrio salinarum]MBK1698879.1 acyloxyacyl hydrolase [Rhodovibrio salinarum]